MSHTTIALSEDTRDELFRLKETPHDSYDDVVRSLIDGEISNSYDDSNTTETAENTEHSHDRGT